MADQPEAAAAAATNAPVDPYRAYNFAVEIEGVGRGHFMRSTPVAFRVQPIRVREAGNNSIVHNLVGPVEYSEVTLSYGLIKADSEALWAWLQSAVSGTVTRKNVSIIMLAPTGDLRWNLMDAWPTRWSGAEMDALGREIAIESITLVYDSLTRA